MHTRQLKGDGDFGPYEPNDEASPSSTHIRHKAAGASRRPSQSGQGTIFPRTYLLFPGETETQWTLFASQSYHSAVTQTNINRLITNEKGEKRVAHASVPPLPKRNTQKTRTRKCSTGTPNGPTKSGSARTLSTSLG